MLHALLAIKLAAMKPIGTYLRVSELCQGEGRRSLVQVWGWNFLWLEPQANSQKSQQNQKKWLNLQSQLNQKRWLNPHPHSIARLS